MRLRLLPWIAAAALLAPGVAQANGRFPATINVHFKPGDPDVFALQATWGLMTTYDGGDTWQWSCEEAVGFQGVYDPDYEFTSTGLLLATTTTPDALRQTRDMCNWTAAPPPLGPDGATPAKFVSQVTVGPDGTIWAVTPYELEPAPQLFRSDDDGQTWVPQGRPFAGYIDWWESLEVAPTLLPGNETRMYLTGFAFSGPKVLRYLLRSDDSGDTWTELGTDELTFNDENAELQIAAISPTDPDLIFARVYLVDGAIGDDIYRSPDAGVTWTRVFEAADNVTAVVVRENGDVILATALSGVHVSTDGGQTFGAAVDDTKVQCMKERDDELLFVCGVSFPPDNMALGTGTTLGEWTPIFTFADVDGAYECAAGTVQADTCADDRWCATGCQFGFQTAECDCGFDAGPDAGDGEDPPKKTCCSSGEPTSAALLVLLVALGLRKRRANPA